MKWCWNGQTWLRQLSRTYCRPLKTAARTAAEVASRTMSVTSLPSREATVAWKMETVGERGCFRKKIEVWRVTPKSPTNVRDELPVDASNAADGLDAWRAGEEGGQKMGFEGWGPGNRGHTNDAHCRGGVGEQVQQDGKLLLQKAAQFGRGRKKERKKDRKKEREKERKGVRARKEQAATLERTGGRIPVRVGARGVGVLQGKRGRQEGSSVAADRSIGGLERAPEDGVVETQQHLVHAAFALVAVQHVEHGGEAEEESLGAGWAPARADRVLHQVLQARLFHRLQQGRRCMAPHLEVDLYDGRRGEAGRGGARRRETGR